MNHKMKNKEDEPWSCKTCKMFDQSAGNFTGHGYCMRQRDSLEGLWTHIEVTEDWFCSDFELKKEEL